MFVAESKDNRVDAEQWTLYLDGASNKNGSGTSMMLKTPEGYKIHCTLHFGFQTSDNKVEYESLIASL